MQHQWFSHLPKEQQEDFKKLVLGSHKVLDRLSEICYNVIQSGVQTAKADYESPSWAYKQADLNGYLRAYREIMALTQLNSTDKERK